MRCAPTLSCETYGNNWVRKMEKSFADMKMALVLEAISGGAGTAPLARRAVAKRGVVLTDMDVSNLLRRASEEGLVQRLEVKVDRARYSYRMLDLGVSFLSKHAMSDVECLQYRELRMSRVGGCRDRKVDVIAFGCGVRWVPASQVEVTLPIGARPSVFSAPISASVGM